MPPPHSSEDKHPGNISESESESEYDSEEEYDQNDLADVLDD